MSNSTWVKMQELANNKSVPVLIESLEKLDAMIAGVRIKLKISDSSADRNQLRNYVWARVAVLDALQDKAPEWTDVYYEELLAKWSKVSE